MKCFKPFCIVVAGLFLNACSSAPEPPNANDAKAETLNTSLPQWKPNNKFISSKGVKDDWYLVTRNFTGSGEVYSPAFWFGLQHSQQIIVSTGKETDWFKVKSWLRSHGATQVIQYQKKPLCNYCTDVYMINHQSSI